MITLKFSATKTILAAGFFILTGLSAQGNVQAELFVLQGEPGKDGQNGKDGKDGAQGPKGDKGDVGKDGLGFTQDTLDYVNSLKTVITVDTTTKTLTFKTDTITVEAQTFEAKGTNGTSIKLDDAARSIKLSATQKNSTTTATFSLEGGDANASPKPNTQYPLAIFNSTNVQVQSGASSTTATVNGLGNLFIGYNEERSNGNERGGSHNLIIGEKNNFKSHSGIVQGSGNTITDTNAAVIGGSGNEATAASAAVIGGSTNKATAINAAVIGGSTNSTNTNGAVVLGNAGEIIKCPTTGPKPLCQK